MSHRVPLSLPPLGGGRCRRQRGASPASLVPPKPPLVCSRWLGRCWFRHSCVGRNPCDLWGSRALPMFALAREVLVPSFLRRQESRRPVGVKGAPNVRRRPIMRGAQGALVGRRADGRSSHRWAVAWIPASAGMTDRAPTAPTELIFNTVALSLRDISPRRPHCVVSGDPALNSPRGGAVAQRLRGRAEG